MIELLRRERKKDDRLRGAFTRIDGHLQNSYTGAHWSGERMGATTMPKLSVAEFDEIIRAELPWAHEMGMRTDKIGRGTASLRLAFKPSMVRPGGVIAGPTIMALADACMFAVAMSRIGKVKLAVTTSFNINFLHRASPSDLIAEGRILKLGRRLAVMDVTVHSDGHDEPVAHATGTYSIPPAEQDA